MNEAQGYTDTAAAEAQSPATAPWTDEQVAAVLATRPEGTYVTEVDEVAQDTPTVH
jgi:hypothetical protein